MVDAYGMSDNALVNMSVLGSETSERSTDYIIEMSEQLRDRTVEELKSHWKQLDAIAHALMENETLYENEIDQLMS